ncbi:hypothetical protein [Bisbaumannia pacifica]|uniref:Cell division protein ZipA n=1 Tax=Bisbaumannia pacifica TaxID=77098 RepID=A0A510X9V3_9GAMM|nr:hypothetical protein [Halomonas pacifica]MBH8579857.1 hypothetical protein [Halomonas pacifica]GEK48184.1 hypothetical protein HPA02_24670 [Halomonas pacifica]
MEPKMLWTILLSGSALVIALGIALAYYRSIHSQPPAPPAEESAASTPPRPDTAPTPTRRASRGPSHPHSRAQTQALKQCWFVVFDTPSEATNRGLAARLNKRNAFYDAELGVYYVTSQSAAYQLTIAHSSSPGRLPPLHQGGEHPPLDGISVLIKFINKRSVVRNPSTFIDLVLDVHALGGRILTSDREEIAPDDFKARLTDNSAENA